MKSQFYGSPEIESVLAVFDVGPGDRFYDRSTVRTEPWADSIRDPLRSLLVTSATKGKYGTVNYVIEEWNGISWSVGAPHSATQQDFAQLIIRDEHPAE